MKQLRQACCAMICGQFAHSQPTRRTHVGCHSRFDTPVQPPRWLAVTASRTRFSHAGDESSKPGGPALVWSLAQQHDSCAHLCAWSNARVRQRAAGGS